MIRKPNRKTPTGKTILEETEEYMKQLCTNTLTLEDDLTDLEVLISNIIKDMQTSTIDETEASYIGTLINICMIILEKIHTRIV